MQTRTTADASAASEGVMRIQLQMQRGGRTIHHESQVLRADGGVTVQQLKVALRQLHRSDAIPGREQSGADSALAKAIKWAEARPPAGVFGRFSKSFYFDPLHPGESWRFDVEGLSGFHLRQ